MKKYTQDALQGWLASLKHPQKIILTVYKKAEEKVSSLKA